MISEPTSYPTALEDELAIIGCCLYGGLESAIDASERVIPEAFSRPEVRDVFAAILTLAAENREINGYTLAVKWRELGYGPLAEDIQNSAEAISSPANLPYHVEAVTEAWRKRHIMETCYGVFTKGKNTAVKYDELILDAEQALGGQELRGVSTLGGLEAGNRMVDDLERRFLLKGALSGVATGLYKLDAITDGMQFGEQTVIGARPSMGKTALGLTIAIHACFRNRVPTLFVSLEMSVEAIMRRLCSAWSEITMNDLRRGSYTEGQFKSFQVFRSFAAKAPLWITDGVGGLNINQVCAAVRRRCRRDGVKLVIIDYLQKIRPAQKQEKKTYEIGETSGALKSLAVGCKCALVTMAQINRESEKDKGRSPRLSDLADSSQIERDADTVALIHRRRDDTEGKAQLIIAKQRDGEVGIVDLAFNGKFARFENPSMT